MITHLKDHYIPELMKKSIIEGEEYEYWKANFIGKDYANSQLTFYKGMKTIDKGMKTKLDYMNKEIILPLTINESLTSTHIKGNKKLHE